MTNSRLICSIALGVTLTATATAQMNKTPNHPSVSMFDQTYTPLSILTRNMGSATDQSEQFPPHHIIANVYYVGTRTLSSFLIVTSQGDILIDSTYERNVPVIEKSVADLGFKFSDIKILLGNHAHGDHMEGDAMVKEATGASVQAMAEDVPMLQNIKPGGKAHPIDKVLHDGDKITLGNVILVAHLTGGHTPGCTTFTTVVTDAGKPYNIVFGCSLRSPTLLTPEIKAQFERSFAVVRKIPCDIMLGDHPAEYGMIDKYSRLKPGAPNPFIDAETCHKEIDIEEAMFHAIEKEQENPPPATGQ